MITPVLQEGAKEAIYIQLYKYIAGEIIGMRLPEHGRMPSVRKLSEHLGISRTTVENAYTQLLDEGYLYSMPKKGYFVSPIGHVRQLAAHGGVSGGKEEPASAKPEAVTDPQAAPVEFDFVGEYLEPACFDAKVWKKHVNAILNYNEDALLTVAAPTGEENLKEAIVQYFYRTRNVKATPDRILVGAGIQTLLEQLAKYFGEKGRRRLLMENPGFNLAKRIFTRNGFELENLDVGDEGMASGALYGTQAKLCYVSPSHQYPTGAILPVKDRYALLQWATGRDAYIIEDDYNSLLRYTGRPIPSMQGMDVHDRVIYAGSFSTILTPAIRISFLVLPESLAEEVKASAYRVQTASKLEQLALARMINAGDFERHLKKIRGHYARKYQKFIGAIETELKGFGRAKEEYAGFYVLFHLAPGLNAEQVSRGLKERGVLVDRLDRYYQGKAPETANALILGFRGLESDRLLAGVARIKDVIAQIAAL